MGSRMTGPYAGVTASEHRQLAELLEQLWPGVRTGDLAASEGQVPAGHRVIDQFRVVPSMRRAQMLLPSAPSAAARSLGHYNDLRQPRTRTHRRVVAPAMRVPLGAGAVSQRLTITAPVGAASEPLERVSLTHHVQQRLTAGQLVAAIGLTNPGPNRKPVLQLFDREGWPVAFVKVGWNDVTTTMVDNEARALAMLERAGIDYPLRPTVLLHDSWNGLRVLATSPMPLDVRGYPRRLDPPTPLPEWRGVKPSLRTSALGESRYWRELTRRAGAVVASGRLEPGDVAALTGVLAHIEQSAATTPMTFGPWHGDWVPWNMARQKGRLWVWDWEHFSATAPVGFDRLHYVYQREFVGRGRSVAAAMVAAMRSGCGAAALLQPPSARGLVASTLYPLELYLRAAALYARGAGWNERFRHGVLHWLGTNRP